MEINAASVLSFMPKQSDFSVRGFRDGKEDREIMIPSIHEGRGVGDINAKAFEKAEHLRQIIIPGSVKIVEEKAFADCPVLLNIIVEEGTEVLQNEAFSGCLSLYSVVLPSSLSSIADDVFANCSALRYVFFHGNSSQWSHLSASLLLPAETRILFYCETTPVNNPNQYWHGGGAEDIASWGDDLCAGLASTEILYKKLGEGFYYVGKKALTKPKHIVVGSFRGLPVVYINENAFYNQTNLTSIIVNEGLVDVGNLAFCGCSSLTSVYLPNSVRTLGDWVLKGCLSLKEFHIPPEINTIGSDEFCGSGLCHIIIPPGWKTITSQMFFKNVNLTSVSLPDSLLSIESSAFAECPSLTHLDLPKKLHSIGDCCFVDSGLNNLVCPAGVTTIGFMAFWKCPHIEWILLPRKLRFVGDGAFSDCPVLKHLFFPGVPVDRDQITFEKNSDKALFDSLVSYYSETVPTDDKNQYWHFSPAGEPISWLRSDAKPAC